MAITLSEQILITKKPLDIKTTPLNDLSDLNTTSIPRSWRYKGMEVIVLNTNTTSLPTRFILLNGTGDNAWKIKDQLTVNTYSDIEQFKPYLLKGTKVTVLFDETNNSQLTDYMTETKNVTNENGTNSEEIILKKHNNEGIIIDEESIINKLNIKEDGVLIYPQSPLYVYKKIDEMGEEQTVYTFNLSEAEENGDFNTILPGFYVTEHSSNSDVVKIITNEEVADNTIYGNDVEEIDDSNE